MTKRQKKTIGVVVGIVVAAVVAWLALRPAKKDDIMLEIAVAERMTVRNSVTATGTVEPVTEVEVGTQVSGIIDKLYVDYNDVVKAGQLIAEMDKVTLEAELQSSQADLASSKTEYEYRLKEYTRTKTLYEKDLVSDSEYDQALYMYETALNTYLRNQADIVRVRQNLEYAMDIAQEEGLGTEFVVVTQEFHMFRALQLAETAGFTAYSLTAQSDPLLLPEYYGRELLSLTKWMVERQFLG